MTDRGPVGDRLYCTVRSKACQPTGDDMAATTKAGPAPNQREQLTESERKATEKEPENFRDVSNEKKVVEIPPLGKDRKPIRGLDPK
jgi:hypothetical protein